MGGRVESTQNAGPEDAGPKVGWNVLGGERNCLGELSGGGDVQGEYPTRVFSI